MLVGFTDPCPLCTLLHLSPFSRECQRWHQLALGDISRLMGDIHFVVFRTGPCRAWTCVSGRAPPGRLRRLRPAASCGSTKRWAPGAGYAISLTPVMVETPVIRAASIISTRSPASAISSSPTAARLGLRPSTAAALDTRECRAAQKRECAMSVCLCGPRSFPWRSALPGSAL